jgi:PKD repeat protein
MIQPDIIATYRTGSGYLSTTFSDPTDLDITHRKWIFGDGIIIEGSGLQTINHTYYHPGEYEVTLIAQSGIDQYSKIKSAYIIVDKYIPVPDFVIAQSFDRDSGSYWRLYLDQSFHMVFEDNENIFRSRNKIAEPGNWIFIEFNRNTRKMHVGSFSYYLKELDVIKFENNNPLIFSDTRTDILLNSTMKMDELRIWSVNKDVAPYYAEGRGKAGYLDTL